MVWFGALQLQGLIGRHFGSNHQQRQQRQHIQSPATPSVGNLLPVNWVSCALFVYGDWVPMFFGHHSRHSAVVLHQGCHFGFRAAFPSVPSVPSPFLPFPSRKGRASKLPTRYACRADLAGSACLPLMIFLLLVVLALHLALDMTSVR